MHTSAELNFTLLKEIGHEGRNSKVFLAHDHQLDADIVIKQIERASFTRESEFFDEAKRLYYSRHPHVVDVKYACIDNDHVYLAMPQYLGGSLHGMLQRRFPTVREIVHRGLDLLAGLHHVHTKGLVHFDVKPSNVLIDGAGRAALSDFWACQVCR
jgi:serine/threonine protein kinase